MAKAAYTPDNDAVAMESSSTVLFESSSRSRWMCPTVAIAGGILCIAGIVCIVVALTIGLTPQCDSGQPAKQTSNRCEYSKEAKRVDLEGFLKEAQAKYFEMNPDDVAWQPGIVDMREHVKNR